VKAKVDVGARWQEAVVVTKFRPEKPGNRVEEKTGTTPGGGLGVAAEA
jgi:hypothetical protein